MFGLRTYIGLDSFQFIQKILATPSSEGNLLLDNKIISEIEVHRHATKATKEIEGSPRERKEWKIEWMKKTECMKQGPTVLKQL